MQKVLQILHSLHPPCFAVMATGPLVVAKAMTAADQRRRRRNFREGTVFIA